MKREDVLGGKYFNADDVRERDLNLVIEEVTQEEFKAEDGYKQKKLVVLFRGTEKKLACGKGKAALLFDLLGDETDDWVGERIRLSIGKTTFAGRRVDCVEVGKPKPKSRPASQDFDEFADRVAGSDRSSRPLPEPVQARDVDDPPY